MLSSHFNKLVSLASKSSGKPAAKMAQQSINRKAKYIVSSSNKLVSSKFMQSRSYAMMHHNDVYVTPDYETPPKFTIPALLRDSSSDLGEKFGKVIRKEKLIPAVLNRGSAKPILLLVDPSSIFMLMKGPSTRFLGRRYHLLIEDVEETYEVIPHNLDVTPVGYYPQSVTFSLWNPKKVPKSKIPPHVHKKFFEPLEEYPSLAEQQRQREEGTYEYKRFMADSIQSETAVPVKAPSKPK